MDKCGSDGEVGVHLYVSDMLVGRSTTMQPTRQKWGYVESPYWKIKQ